MFKLKGLVDERGISEVLGAILVLGMVIAVGSVVYSQYVQSSVHSSEADHMNAVQEAFIKLKSSIAAMEIGQSSIANIEMNTSFPPLVPTSGEVGTLSFLPGIAYHKGATSYRIENNKGSVSGSLGALKADDNSYLEVNQVIFNEKFPNTSDWTMYEVPPDNGGDAFFDTYSHTGDGTGSISVTTSGQFSVSFVAAGTGSGVSGNNNYPTPRYPTGLRANDLILLQVTVRDTSYAPTTTPTGFTLLYDPDSTGTGRQWIYYKFSDGTESGTITVTIGGSSCKIARMYAFRNVARSSFTEGANFGSGTGRYISAQSVTTTNVNRLAVSFVFVNDDNPVGSFINETGGNWTEAVSEFRTNAGSDGCVQLQTAAMATAGTISGGSYTMTASDPWGVRAFALIPISRIASTENAYWEHDFGDSLDNYPNVTLEAWFGKEIDYSAPPMTDNVAWWIEAETNIHPESKTLYAHQEYPQEYALGNISFVAAGTGSGTTSNPTPAYPTGLRENDLILMQVTVRDESTTPNIPTDTGFTLLYGPDSMPGNRGRQWIYYKFSDGTESGTITVTIGGDTCKIARMYAFRNVALTSFTEGEKYAWAYTDTILAQPVTTTDVNRLAVSFVFVTTANSVGSFINETGGDWTEAVAEYTNASEYGGCVQLQTAAMASAGTISGGSYTMTPSDYQRWGVRAFALIPKLSVIPSLLENYHLLKENSADTTGTNLSVSTASIGRQLLGKFVYPLTGLSTLPASLWNFYYRSWYSVELSSTTNSPSSVPAGSWTNQTGAYTSNNVYASSATGNQTQQYGNYGFSIPSDVTITKVEVGREAYTSGNDAIGISCSWNGGTNWATENVSPSLGISDPDTTTWVDFTSATTWAVDDLSNANFQTRAREIKIGSADGNLTNNPSSVPAVSWTSPNNAYADGGGYASITSGTPSASQTYQGYHFSIPNDSTITGVRVRYDAWSIGTTGLTTSENPTANINGTNPWTNPGSGYTSDDSYATAAAKIPTYRATGAVESGTGAITPALPDSMSPNDIVILVAGTIAGGSISITANGSITTWTALAGSPIDVTGGEKLYVWWGRWASGTTGPTLTPGSNHCIARTIAYYNCYAGGSPIDVSATGTETTSDQSFSFATGLTSTYNNELAIAICSTGTDTTTAQFSTMANTSLASLTERMDSETTSGGGGGFALDEGTKITAGTLGTWTSTLGTASPKAYISFALMATVPANIYDQIYGTFGITGSDTITKVEIGYEAYSSVAEQLDLYTSDDGGSSWNTIHTTANLGTSDPDFYTYIDVTSDTTWTWTLLNDTNFKYKVVTHWLSGTPTWSIDALIVRVTYTAANDEQIRVDVSWDGGTNWSSKQTTDLNGTEITYWYDVTGATSWTPAKLTDDNLRVRVDAYTVGNPSVVRLDYIPVEVTYTAQDTVYLDYIPVRVTYTDPTAAPVAHAEVTISILADNGSPRHYMQPYDAAVSNNITSTENTYSATYLFNYNGGDYTVENDNDYLEIDYYCHVTSAAPGTAYLKIDDNTLAIDDQTRVEDVLFTYLNINPWNTVLSYAVSTGFDESNGTKYWYEKSTLQTLPSGIEDGIIKIRAHMYDNLRPDPNAVATYLSTWTDDITLFAGPPFEVDTVLTSMPIIAPESVDNIVENLAFFSKDSPASYTLQIQNSDGEWETFTDMPDPVSVDQNKVYWVETIGGAESTTENDNPRNYIYNNAINIRITGYNDSLPFSLCLDYLNFQVNYKENSENYLASFYGSSGRLTFTMINYSYPNQTYVYDDGAVIVSQLNSSAMASSGAPLPDLMVVTDSGNGKTKVEVNHFVLTGIGKSSISRRGWSAIRATVVDSYYVNQGTNVPNVSIEIYTSPYTDQAWVNYLSGLFDDFEARGYNPTFSKDILADTGGKHLTLTIYGDISYYETVTEVQVQLA
jgi:hypothetical protein